MDKGPKCIANIENICDGLNLVRMIKRHAYTKVEDLEIVLKTMYPHAQYNDHVPVKHGCKCHYRDTLHGILRNKSAYLSTGTFSKLVLPIYNFDIANPEYIEPNTLELEDLIPALAEFVTNRKFPEDADTELISIGKPINSCSFYDYCCSILNVVKLLRYNDTALFDSIRSNFAYEVSLFITRTQPYWFRFAQDPNFAYISITGIVMRNIPLKGILGVIYDKLLQEREASEQQAPEINVDEMRHALEEIIPGYVSGTDAESDPSVE